MLACLAVSEHNLTIALANSSSDIDSCVGVTKVLDKVHVSLDI